jgi:transporter family-2 protein
MRGLAWILGLVAGFGLAVQVGMNSQLRRVLQSANLAALVSFTVGTLALVLVVVAMRAPLPPRETLASVPFWVWLGGLPGAFYVASSTIVATELGATTLLGLALVGQLATALIIDHYGWMGLPENPITWNRVAGVALVGIGVWLVSR